MGLFDFFRSMNQPKAQVPMQAEQPASSMTGGGNPMGGIVGGLSGFNEKHPGFLMGAGQLLKGDDLNPAILYAMGVKKERKAEAEKTANQNKTKAWLLSQGVPEAEIDAAIANGEVGGYFKKDTGKAAWINAGDGNLYNPDLDEWIRPPMAEGGMPVDKDAFSRERDTRKDYDSEAVVKGYKGIRDSYERIRASAMTDSGPGDVGLIYNYMKMIDPGAVVREGDFATAENAGGIDNTIRTLYNRIVDGERLTPELRQQFVTAAEKLYGEASANLTDTNQRYSDIATDWQIDPSRVVVAPEQYPPLKLGEKRELPSGVTIKKIGD
jgi:hypothetical protein